MNPLTPAPEEVVDDRAATVGEHERDLVFHAQEHPADVHGHDAVELVVGDVGQGRGRLLDTGVVERGVEATVGVDRGGQCGLDVLGAGDVAAHRQGVAAEVGDGSGGVTNTVLADVGDDDVGSGAGEGQGGGAADAAGRAGDERGLSGEAVSMGHR